MNDLIKIGLNENNEPVVSGRELQKGLKIKKHYTQWIETYLSYGYEENVDYIVNDYV